MKFYISIILLISLISCAQENKSTPENAKLFEEAKDTILIKQQNVLNKSYEVGFFSKSFSYYWVTAKDTIDFLINVVEYEKDSTFHINIHHKKPMLFTTILDKLNQSLPTIMNDFDSTKFSSIYFKSPIYYLDLAKELSSQYQQTFGRKSTSYPNLNVNEFLFNSNLNKRLTSFLNPLNKKVKWYSIEKFQLMDKSNFNSYLPGIDLADHPKFTIDGMGVSVELEGK